MKLSELLKLEPEDLNKMTLDEINSYLPRLSQMVKRRVQTLKDKKLSKVSLSIADHDTKLLVRRKHAKNIYMGKAFLFDVVQWLNLETSTVTGTRKWMRNVNKFLGTKMNAKQMDNFFTIFNKYKELYKTGLALYGSSSLMKTTYNVVFDEQNKNFNEVQLTELIENQLQNPVNQSETEHDLTNNKLNQVERTMTNEINNAKNKQMAERSVAKNARNKNKSRKR